MQIISPAAYKISNPTLIIITIYMLNFLYFMAEICYNPYQLEAASIKKVPTDLTWEKLK